MPQRISFPRSMDMPATAVESAADRPTSDAATATTAASTPRRSGRLFRKYFILILALVTGALLIPSSISLYFSYRETLDALHGVQQEKALAAASRIEQYIVHVQSQLRGAALPQLGAEGAEQRRLEFLKLLKQVPDVTDIAYIGADGCEKAQVSRLAMDTSRRVPARPLGGSGLQAAHLRGSLLRPGVLSQGNRAVHADRRALGKRQGAGHRRRREPQVHVGRDHADPHRRAREGVRRRRVGLPDRRSRHRARAAQDRSFGARARPGGAGRRRRCDAGGRDPRRRRQRGPDRVRERRSARLEGVRRATRSGSTRAAGRIDLAHRRAAARRAGHLGAGGVVPRARNGAADSHAAGRRAADRRRQARPRDRGQDRRRAGSAGRTVQPHDRRSFASPMRGWSARSRSAPLRSRIRWSSKPRSARSCA